VAHDLFQAPLKNSMAPSKIVRAQVVEANGDLDQALVVGSVPLVAQSPKVLPAFVSGEITAVIEELYPLHEQIAHRGWLW
jgi:hypothetical protein